MRLLIHKFFILKAEIYFFTHTMYKNYSIAKVL